MDLKVYKRTRYQNIYKHIKNGNYVISMSKPIKTSISRIDNLKIFSIEEAIKIRDNISIKQQRAVESLHKDNFDTLWDKYMFWCKNIDKQAYNTINKKKKVYHKHFEQKIDKPVSKITKEYICNFIDDCDTTNKQKNHLIKCLKTFFNWCINEERKYLLNNPLANVSGYRVQKTIRKFWTPEQFKNFLNTIELDFKNEDISIQFKARLIYTFTIIGFSLGDRVGETRALSFNSIDIDKKTIHLLHSINYDTSSSDFVSSTKTYESERIIDITDKTINTVIEYKAFLINKMNYDVKESDLIFLNFNSKKPYNDATLRKHFNHYIKKANVEKIRMYDLRHTYAATMMSEGKEAYLFSQRMGHKNIKTTIDVYGHLSNETRKEIAQSTDKYI